MNRFARTFRLSLCLALAITPILPIGAEESGSASALLAKFLEDAQTEIGPLNRIEVRFEANPGLDTSINRGPATDDSPSRWPTTEHIQQVIAVLETGVPEDPGVVLAIGSDPEVSRKIGQAALLSGAGIGNDRQIGATTDLIGIGECEDRAIGEWGELADASETVSSAGDIRSKAHYSVFHASGESCWSSRTRVTQGDLLFVGVIGAEDELSTMKVDVPTCSLEPDSPTQLDTIAGIGKQDAVDSTSFRTLKVLECFDDEITLQFKKADKAIATKKVKQYKRYRSTVQLGMLWTDLDDQEFSTIDRGAGPVIRSDLESGKGPEVVSSLVVYGLPHYLSTFGSRRYAGRDIVNHNGWKDRIGLALTFGVEDPTDSIGLGLSFEVATGINITLTQYYRKTTVLDELSLGDAFTGTDIPTRRRWKNDLVFGFSIDGRYLGKLLGGGGDK